MSVQSQFTRKRLRGYWEDPDTFGTSLLILLIDHANTLDVLTWEPETMRLEIHDSCGARVPHENMDKVLALVSALTTDLFYKSLETFIQVCNSLGGAGASFGVFDPVEPEEAAWALTEVGLLDPPTRGEEFDARFDDEIRRYLGLILNQDGIQRAPDILYMAIRDTVPGQDTQQSFADDPAMFNAFHDFSDKKARAITQYVREQTAELFDQLEKLPLQNADPGLQGLLDRYRKWSRLPSAAAGEPAAAAGSSLT